MCLCVSVFIWESPPKQGHCALAAPECSYNSELCQYWALIATEPDSQYWWLRRLADFVSCFSSGRVLLDGYLVEVYKRLFVCVCVCVTVCAVTCSISCFTPGSSPTELSGPNRSFAVSPSECRPRVWVRVTRVHIRAHTRTYAHARDLFVCSTCRPLKKTISCWRFSS